MADIAALSTEAVRVKVASRLSGAVVDPTSYTVTMAFIAPGTAPVSGDWKAATWETDTGSYYARCLVGPSGVQTLTAGQHYEAWVKVAASPETPIKKAGRLIVY